MINPIELGEDDFKSSFYETMHNLAKTKEGNTTLYGFNAHRNEENWFGVDVRRLVVSADNCYEMWLKVDEIFTKAASKFNLFDLHLILEIVYDEMDEHECEYNMEEIVEIVLDSFKNNDTFWYKEMSQS